MRVKKLLALALAGMILAGCLSGCDRTIIEHQFHTNTVTNTETVPVEVENEALLKFQSLEKFFYDHGSTFVNTTISNTDLDLSGYSTLYDNEISPEEMDNFLQLKKSKPFTVYEGCDDPAQAFDCLLNCVDLILLSLNSLTDTQLESLDQMITINGGIYINGGVFSVPDDPTKNGAYLTITAT